ncbi:MAG TPA: hemerythrin domain-containing protein [Candidatus Dormibacteraeota bacterium]|nr:hemerythrin domain-containing protein [Candidatus Dormibacteraeota bacterium]
MDPILEELFRQHRDAEAMLVRLAAGTARVRREGAGGPGVLGELFEIRREIQGEVRSHFREEELALFPVLGRHIDSSSGPIAMLMEEHALFRQLELQLEEALASLESGRHGAWAEKLCEAGDAIGQLLPAHIEKEEGVLFPMAESTLEESEWAEVRQLWSEAMKAAQQA